MMEWFLAVAGFVPFVWNVMRNDHEWGNVG